jgi:hypothetical protein
LAGLAEAAGPRTARPPAHARRRTRSCSGLTARFAQHHPILAERGRDCRCLLSTKATSGTQVVATYDSPAGCSVVFYPGEGTKDGHGILSRNFDFPTATFTQIVGFQRPTSGPAADLDRRAAP